MIDWGKCFGFDLETHGDKKEYALQAYRLTTGQAKIKAASVCNSKGQGYSVLNPDHAKIGNFLSMVAGKDGYVVGWNVTFDAAWCVAAGLEKEVFAVKWLDGMLLWRHAVVEPEGDNIPRGKRKSYSLESAMKEFYPEHAGFKEFDDFQANDAESLELLKKRNVEDARWTLKLAHRFYHALSPAQQVAARIEARSIPLMAKTRVLGIYSSADEAEDLGEFLKREAISIYRRLLETSPEIRGINLNSTPQLQELIYEKWGLPATRFSEKTGKPSTDKYALFDLAALDPRAALLKKLREAKNNRTKYAQGTLKSLEYNGDGYVRPQGKIFSTYTSRITYGSSDEAEVEVVKTTKAKGTVVTTKKAQIPVGVALHQWKRGREYRRLIKPPPGYDIVELDAAGQEFRWMGVASEDETMLSLCEPGEDAHSYMGSKVARVDYRELIRLNKEDDAQAYLDRKCGKFCNLSYQYRVSPKTATVKARVEYEMDVDEAFINNTLYTYKQAYPGVEQYWAQQIRKCKSLGYAETFAGRRVQLLGSWAGKMRWPMESTSINYPIQGTGGDQKYLALAVARGLLPKYNGYFYYELHDGLFFIFPHDKTIKAAIEFNDVLSNLPYKQAWGIDLPIKFPFDCKIGTSWGELKDLDKFL